MRVGMTPLAQCARRPLVMRASAAQQPCRLVGRPAMLQSSFLGTALRIPSAGGALWQPQRMGTNNRRQLTVEANGKRCIGDTNPHGTRRHRTRTSGFRRRRLTPNGRKVLAARRKKGRHTLCPANSRTNVKSTASSDRR